MKLCFLAGANSIHFYRWVKYFTDMGHEVHWISLTPNLFGNMGDINLYLMKRFFPKPINILLNIIIGFVVGLILMSIIVIRRR